MPAYATYPSLSGKTAFVTGGASGIGADIVRALTASGTRTAFVDLLEPEGRALATETGALFLPCDITDLPALAGAINATRDQLGPIGILVNNAANDDRRPIDDVTPDYWDNSMAINLKPQFFAAQQVRPQMQSLGGGAIINFSSIAWRHGAEHMAVYATAKSAILGLTRALGRAFGPDNIRVNAIEPGAVITDRQRRLWYPTDAAVADLVDRQAITEILTGTHIARAVLFLASDDAAMITKQSLIVDAGIR